MKDRAGRFQILGLGIILLMQAASAIRSSAAQPRLSKKQLNYIIAHAKTPQDHQELAAYYRHQAEQVNLMLAELPIECGGFSGSVNPHADVANGQSEYQIGTT